MLVRALIAFSFFQLAAISAARAADSDVSCDTATITAESNMPLDRAPLIGCFQNNSIWDDTAPAPQTGLFDQVKTVEISSALLEQVQNTISGTTSISENGAPQGLIAAERYGKTILTVIGNTLSKQNTSNKPSLMPSTETETRSLFNDMSFEDLAPFAPMFEDGASWK